MRNFLLGLALFATANAAASSLPQFPGRLVYDEDKNITKQFRTSLEDLLLEHRSLTGQQILVAVFKAPNDPANKMEEQEFTHQISQVWASQNTDIATEDSLLLAIFPEKEMVKAEIGYSIESLLPQDSLNEITTETILRGLKLKKLDAGLSKGVYRILEALDSPLISSGKALDILKSDQFSLEEADIDTLYLTQVYGKIFLACCAFSAACVAGWFYYKRKKQQREGGFSKFDESWGSEAWEGETNVIPPPQDSSEDNSSESGSQPLS